MNKPVLVVMAAGMGSRYGGLKQLDPVGTHGELIIDYSIYDARQAGFETVVFVIKEEIDQAFREAIGNRLSQVMEVRYAYQDRFDLPEGYTCPEGREKPWGTAHAVLAARKVIDGPFAVINADDYYGPNSFKEIYTYLSAHPDTEDGYEYAMVGYLLENTVTENGHVARGVCQEDSDHFLTSVIERTKILKGETCPRYTEDEGATWHDLPGDTIVSMNLWGFSHSYLEEAWAMLPGFLDRALKENPLKAEFFLPYVVSQLIEAGKARVKVLRSTDRWYGVTYREDRPRVVAAIQGLAQQGMYPQPLWGK
ncbi:MAG: nucleotidyltransferase [Ruminococcaceae bacterium]|nr:nucleotidyltransferase [Oscillospiraceae bacterium]